MINSAVIDAAVPIGNQRPLFRRWRYGSFAPV